MAPGHAAALDAWQTASNAAALDATPTRAISVALHSDDLGAVQLHASLHDNVLGAAIAVDRPEVHNWLAAQLPELQRTLTARQFQVGSLSLQQHAGSNSGGSGGGAAQYAQPRTPTFTGAPAPSPSSPPASDSQPPAALVAPYLTARLNVRA